MTVIQVIYTFEMRYASVLIDLDVGMGQFAQKTKFLCNNKVEIALNIAYLKCIPFCIIKVRTNGNWFQC